MNENIKKIDEMFHQAKNDIITWMRKYQIDKVKLPSRKGSIIKKVWGGEAYLMLQTEDKCYDFREYDVIKQMEFLKKDKDEIQKQCKIIENTIKEFLGVYDKEEENK